MQALPYYYLLDPTTKHPDPRENIIVFYVDPAWNLIRILGVDDIMETDVLATPPRMS